MTSETHEPSGNTTVQKQRMAGAPKQRMGAPPAAPPAPDSEVAPKQRMAAPTVKVASGSAATAGPTEPAALQPSPRKGRRRTWLGIAALVIVVVAAILAARWLRSLPAVAEFITAYPGQATQPASVPEGLPAWLGWQHFLNMFFMVLIVRTGLQVRLERRPPAHWTASRDSFFSPRGNTPKKVSLSQWLHQVLDVLWVVNGLVFMVLLFATGHWMRIVPTSWDVVPNMLSAALQYASLDWPVENGWVHYNALQMMAYFLTVFVAAPLAMLSGLRFSTWWPEKARGLSRVYPVEWARAVHFPVMLYFAAFTAVHVFLVFFTGALRNLNHMYTSRDVVDWWGLAVFVLSLVAVAGAWLLTRPLFMTAVAGRMGKVSK